MLTKNLGYLGKFTEWLFGNDDVSLGFLQDIYNEIKKVGLDTDINKFKTAEDLYDYLTNVKIDTKVNQIIKSLPSRSRKLVNQKLKDLIGNNIKSADIIKDFYSKKGGRYNNINDLIKDTKSLIENSQGKWDSSGIDYKEDELVYKDSTTLILHIKTYDRSCDLGSKHWCISTSDNMFEQYTDNFNKQYFIYDFTKDISDKKSMIGVTINMSGNSTYIHYKDDTPAKSEDISPYMDYLKPYSKSNIFEENPNIYDDVSNVFLLDDVEYLKENFKSIQKYAHFTLIHNMGYAYRDKYNKNEIIVYHSLIFGSANIYKELMGSFPDIDYISIFNRYISDYWTDDELDTKIPFNSVYNSLKLTLERTDIKQKKLSIITLVNNILSELIFDGSLSDFESILKLSKKYGFNKLHLKKMYIELLKESIRFENTEILKFLYNLHENQPNLFKTYDENHQFDLIEYYNNNREFGDIYDIIKFLLSKEKIIEMSNKEEISILISSGFDLGVSSSEIVKFLKLLSSNSKLREVISESENEINISIKDIFKLTNL